MDRIDYFERMLADNPDNPTGLLALANEYGKAGRHEDEAAVLERYVATHGACLSTSVGRQSFEHRGRAVRHL
jgi:hypothetical protein